ncbi:early endosome antigen 1-like [Bolinopsis microptera]|uniref:early endosome antigen 1-like n=1 Tax=Bolinopsis microptera TaxID=2820187 RepID=UPI0030792A03
MERGQGAKFTGVENIDNDTTEALATNRIESTIFSCKATKHLKEAILKQVDNYTEDWKHSRTQELESTPLAKFMFQLAAEKGASAWLTALPLKEYGYLMNKQQFSDAIALRYNLNLEDSPKTCTCGQKYSANHALICKLGGVRFHDRSVDKMALNQVSVPTDFGRRHIGAPSDGDLTFNLGEGVKTIKADSNILSLNSPVIHHLTTELQQTCLEADDFSREAVDCFIEACYTGKVEALNQDNFRDVNKMGHVFQVDWLSAKCNEYFVAYVEGLSNWSASYLDILFAVSEALYVVIAIKKNEFYDVAVTKLSSISTFARNNFVKQYLPDITSSSKLQLDFCVAVVKSDVQVLAELLAKHLKERGYGSFGENCKYLLTQIDLQNSEGRVLDIHSKLFAVLEDLESSTDTDLKLLRYLYKQNSKQNSKQIEQLSEKSHKDLTLLHYKYEQLSDQYKQSESNSKLLQNMSDSCAKCCELKKECRCGRCASCEADIGSDNKQLMTIFKKRKIFCRHCNLPLCGKCLVNSMCSSCNKVQDSYNALWREIDVSLVLSSKEKDFDNALDDMITAIKEQSLSTVMNLLEHCGKSYLDMADSDGQTLLHHAVKTADVEILQYLLDQGGNVNLVDNEGCSLLHHLAAGPRTPKQGQICDTLVSNGINTFLMSNKRETALAISLQTDNFELQTLLEPTMFRDSSAIILKCLNTKLDLPDDVSACLRYIVSKIKCLNPFEKKQNNKVGRNKSINYRSLKDRGGVIAEGVDPYKLKKTVADNNEKITRLKEEIQTLRDEVVLSSEEHKVETDRFEATLSEEKENKIAALLQLKDYYNNTISILETDLLEAKTQEEDAKQGLVDMLGEALKEAITREKMINELLLCESALAESEQMNVNYGGYIKMLRTGWRETKQHLRDLEINSNRALNAVLAANSEMVKLNKKRVNTITNIRDVVSKLEMDLEASKYIAEDALRALEEVLQLNKKYKLCWVPKSVTRKCGNTECSKVFRDGYSQHHCRCCGRVFCYDCSIQRLPIPVYGYEAPVRICSYCYNLLNEEVLCDFDETDIDIDQWNSVHYQNESNVDNLGRKSFFKFGTQRSRTNTVTSGYTSGSKSAATSECGSEDSPTTSLSSQSTSSLTSGMEDCAESVQQDNDSDSTLSGNSEAGSEDISSVPDPSNMKMVGNQWKNFQNIFKKNTLSRNSFKRSSSSLKRS